jgi:hypothetical protein
MPASLMVMTPQAREGLNHHDDQQADANEQAKGQRQDEMPMSPAALKREFFVQWQERDAFCAMVKRYLEGKELPDDKDEALHMLMNREGFRLTRTAWSHTSRLTGASMARCYDSG